MQIIAKISNLQKKNNFKNPTNSIPSVAAKIWLWCSCYCLTIMSLSQKHAGLVLVPWLNREEWNYVYHCINSADPQEYKKALEILEIWKIRTPILSAGIQGTMIILDVLSTQSISSRQQCYIYSVGILRFLNLSAANSEKQGEFTKMSNRNELPDWLINLRHDIAHGHNMPSLAMLRQGLEFGLGWLKEKYWDPQSKIIKDFRVTQETYQNNTLKDILPIYVDLKLNSLQASNITATWLENAKELIFKRTRRRPGNLQMMINILEEMLRQGLSSAQNKYDNEELVLDYTVKNVLLNRIGANGFSKINEDFLRLWENLLDILHAQKLLLKLVRKLYDVTSSVEFDDNIKNMSAIWINDIFKALLQLKELHNEESKNDTESKSENNFITLKMGSFYKEETQEFQETILTNPSVFSKQFVEVLFKYNNSSSEITKDALYLINQKITNDENLHNLQDQFLTANDLDFCTDKNTEDKTQTNMNVISDRKTHKTVKTQMVDAGLKWIKIRDTACFMNCPLGILPHQIGMKHPLLAV